MAQVDAHVRERHERVRARAGVPSRMPRGYRAEDHMPGVATDGFVSLTEAAAEMGGHERMFSR